MAKKSKPLVRVRMYRQGLGDCFLLTFNVGGNAERHILIDCGTLGAKTTGVEIGDVVDDILATTGSHIDLVIATHEHKDHVSAFNSQAKKFVDPTTGKHKVDVDNVWMAWTENPKDDLAKDIKKYKNDLGQALMAAITAIPQKSALASDVRALLDFSDVDSPDQAAMAGLAADKFAPTIDKAMHFVRKQLGPEAEYRLPGEVHELDWLPGFRVYVLGPPRDETKLKVLGDHGSSELYGLAAAFSARAPRDAAAAASASDLQRQADQESEMPFDRRYRAMHGDAEAFSADGRKWYPSYVEDRHDWRRIDGEWNNVAADLALQLDSVTNNTSLALAFERIADGKVLLFPADAQQGNWVSWHDDTMKWTVKDKAGVKHTFTAEDLLNRTVFYKVGHHGSHNATAKGKGLEMMTRESELTAFIPVDRKVALNKGSSGWNMPARALYKRLLEKCQGRVARSDIGLADDAANAKDQATEKELRDLADAAQWKKWRAAQKASDVNDSNPLFLDYTLK